MANKNLQYLIEQAVRKELKSIALIKEYEDPLLQIFVQPFTDIIDTAKAGVEKLSAIAWTEIGSLTKQAALLAIPFLSIDTMDEIQENAEKQLKERLADIDKRYSDVLQRNYDAMRSRDLWGVAFLFNPELLLGTRLAMRAPESVLIALEALTGGNPSVIRLREKLEQINKFILGGGDPGSAISNAAQYSGYDIGWADGGGDYGYFGEQVQPNGNVQNNQQQQQIQKRQQIAKQVVGQELLKALKSTQIQQAIKSSPIVGELQSIAIDSVMKTANEISSLNSYEDFQRYFGEDFQKFEQELKKTIKQEPTPQQEQQFKKEIVPLLKKNVLNMYSDQVKMMGNKFPQIQKQLFDIAKNIKNMQ